MKHTIKKQTDADLYLQQYLIERKQLASSDRFSLDVEQGMFNMLSRSCLRGQTLSVNLTEDIAKQYISDKFLHVNKVERILKKFDYLVITPDAWGTKSVQIRGEMPEGIKNRIDKGENYINYTDTSNASFAKLIANKKEGVDRTIYPVEVIDLFGNSGHKRSSKFNEQWISWNDGRGCKLPEVSYLYSIFPDITFETTDADQNIYGIVDGKYIAVMGTWNNFVEKIDDYFPSAEPSIKRIIPMCININIIPTEEVSNVAVNS